MARVNVSTATTGAWMDKTANTLFIERVFDAPRELVFKAFTEPDRIERWWGPREWPTKNKKMDVRPGGVWHYCMTGPDGTEAWGKAVYREIIPPEKIVYVDTFSDPDGNDNQSMPSMLITFQFLELGNKTKMSATTEFATLEHMETVAEMGMVQGLSESLDRLEELLAS